MVEEKAVKNMRPAWRGYLFHFIATATFVIFSYYILLLKPYPIPVIIKKLHLISNPIYQAIRPHFFYIPLIVLLGVVLLIIYSRFSRLYTITPKELSARRWTKRTTTSIPLDKVTDIYISQSRFGRLLDIGDIHITASGSREYKIVLFSMRHPCIIKSTINSTRGETTERKEEEECKRTPS